MEPRSTRDLLSGVALAAFGLYVTIASLRFDYLSDAGPGPGFLPFWLGIAILSLAACLIVVNQLRAEAPKSIARLRSWSGEKRALSVWLALMGMILISPFLGFTVSLMLLTIFIVACMERRPLWSAIVVALGLGVCFHLVFVAMLRLSLPISPLGF